MFRTWAHKTISGVKGDWKADVLDDKGVLLGSVAFTVQEQARAPRGTFLRHDRHERLRKQLLSLCYFQEQFFSQLFLWLGVMVSRVVAKLNFVTLSEAKGLAASSGQAPHVVNARFFAALRMTFSS